MNPEPGMYTIAFGLHREKGPVRAENQDQITHFQSSVFGHVFIVADGMGGHESGAIAATMAITGFKQHFQNVSLKLPLRESIAEAARLTNLDIFEKSGEKGNGGNPLRMGSTLVLCVIAGNSCTVASAGDSRCYSFRNGELKKLTKDHTAAQKMVDSGIISPEEARNHPDSSVLTRAFGQRPEIEIDILDPYTLAEDERLLLCSDGLYGYVDEAALVDRLRKNADPQAAADALLQLALDAGGHDNISIFVIRVERSPLKASTAPDPPLEAEAPDVASAAAVSNPRAASESAPRSAAPVPARSNKLRRFALGLLAISIAIAGAAAIFLLRPDLVPVAVRERLAGLSMPDALRNRLAAWGFSVSDRDSADQPAPEPVRETKSTAPDKHADPAAPASAAAAEGTAPAQEVKPAGAQAKEVAAAPQSAPAGVFIAYPPAAAGNEVFLKGITGLRDKLRTAGYNATLSPKPVQQIGVWRVVTPNPMAFAPPHLYLSAVFLPGFRKDALKVCGIVMCSDAEPRLLVPEARPAFERAFSGGAVILFAYPPVVPGNASVPGAAASERPEHPAGTPRE